MTDPFNILGPEPEDAPLFADALREALDRLQDSASRFETLCEQVPEEKFTDEEWRIVEQSAEDVARAVEAVAELLRGGQAGAAAARARALRHDRPLSPRPPAGTFRPGAG